MPLKVKTTPRETGNRLMKVRKEFKLHKREMASRLMVSHSTYHRYETDRALPGIEVFTKLFVDFGVSLNYLLFGKGPVYWKDIPSSKELSTKNSTNGTVKGNQTGQELAPEIKELIEYLEKEPVLRYDILGTYHRYKEQKEKTSNLPGGAGKKQEDDPQ